MTTEYLPYYIQSLKCRSTVKGWYSILYINDSHKNHWYKESRSIFKLNKLCGRTVQSLQWNVGYVTFDIISNIGIFLIYIQQSEFQYIYRHALAGLFVIFFYDLYTWYINNEQLFGRTETPFTVDSVYPWARLCVFNIVISTPACPVHCVCICTSDDTTTTKNKSQLTVRPCPAHMFANNRLSSGIVVAVVAAHYMASIVLMNNEQIIWIGCVLTFLLSLAHTLVYFMSGLLTRTAPASQVVGSRIRCRLAYEVMTARTRSSTESNRRRRRHVKSHLRECSLAIVLQLFQYIFRVFSPRFINNNAMWHRVCVCVRVCICSCGSRAYTYPYICYVCAME